MFRNTIRLIAVAGLAPFLINISAKADDAERDASHSFKCAITITLETEVAGKKQKDGDAQMELYYTWNQKGKERTLSFDSMSFKEIEGGRETMSIFMSRAKFRTEKDDKVEEVTYEKAPDKTQKKMRDAFGTPLCKRQVDENGKEIKREILAAPEAKQIRDLIDNVLVFHPPFSRTENEWSANTEMNANIGVHVKGALKYKKIADRKDHAVTVSGTLSAKDVDVPSKSLTIKKAEYVIRGEQTFDLAAGEWSSGKLSIDLNYQMASGADISSKSGTLVVELTSLPKNK